MTKILTYSIVTHQSLFRQAFIILSLILLEQFSSLAQPNLFGPQNLIAEFPNGTFSICVADLDEDEDQDLLLAFFNDDKIAWYENDGSGNFGEPITISIQTNAVSSLYAIDLDGDEDIDVLSASYTDDNIVWYENYGSGNFGDQNIIDSLVYLVWSVIATDIDADGDQDVVAASELNDEILWYENNGNGNFGGQNFVSSQAHNVSAIIASDFDGDGDQDILSSSVYNSIILWYRNDGFGNFSNQNIVSTMADNPESIIATDFDGDGDQDILSSASDNNDFFWHENDGNGNFSEQIIVSPSYDINTNSVFAQDLDGDGDQDVLASSSSDGVILWFENDGNGNFNEEMIVGNQVEPATNLFATDLDGDGDSEVLSASIEDNRITWYENLQLADSDFIIDECPFNYENNEIKNTSNFTQFPSTTYQWNINNQVVSTSTNLDHNLLEPGNYFLTLISCTVSSCDTTTKPINVLAFELDSVPILLTNTPYTFTNTSYNIGYWVWEFGDGGIEEIQTPTHTYSEPGIYELEVNIYNTEIAEDCFFQMEYSVTVIGSPTGLDELPSNSLIVHPNPADQYLTLSSPELVPGAVFRLYNLLGQELITHRMDSSEEIAIPSGELSEGIYFFKLSSSEVVHKIVVAH